MDIWDIIGVLDLGFFINQSEYSFKFGKIHFFVFDFE